MVFRSLVFLEVVVEEEWVVEEVDAPADCCD
jgi:hypothetical protein